MNRRRRIFIEGLLKENPLLVSAMGICPALAVTTRASNGFGMGIALTFVLICTGLALSALKRVIPSGIRIPCYMIISASFVTIASLLLKAYVPGLHSSIGPYLPLLAVNCVILERAEVFSTKNSIADSTLHGFACGLGYTAALTLMGALRELFGSGELFGAIIIPGFPRAPMFLLAPGGFLVLGALIAAVNSLSGRNAENCDGGCAGCPLEGSCSKEDKEAAK